MAYSKMAEADFQANVVQLAHSLGWRIHHDGGDMSGHTYGDPGFPDLVLARRGTVIFAELKSEAGAMTEAQLEWMLHLAHARMVAASATSYIWKPSDIDVIGKVLSKR